MVVADIARDASGIALAELVAQERIEDLDSLEETPEILSDPAVLADVREAALERSKGEALKLSKDEVLARLRQQ